MTIWGFIKKKFSRSNTKINTKIVEIPINYVDLDGAKEFFEYMSKELTELQGEGYCVSGVLDLSPTLIWEWDGKSRKVIVKQRYRIDR